MKRSLALVTTSILAAIFPLWGQAAGRPQSILTSHSVWPHLRPFLSGIGDRIVARGKERSTLTGVIRRAGAGSESQIRVIQELSGKLRIEEGTGGAVRVTGFDGKAPWAATGGVGPADTDLIETLLNDSAEHFFVSQANGAPTRFYGSAFRMDDGKNPNYRGPYYDVYEVGDLVTLGGQTLRRAKVYCLNTQTLVLERVHYRTGRPGAGSRVEVLIGGWRKLAGDAFPQSVSRSENGANVFTITWQTANPGPALEDGIFSPGR